MGNGRFKAAKRDIRAFRRAANYDTKGDYKATQSQIDSIYSNLRTSGGGLRSNLTSTQQRELAAMDRIRSRNVKASAQVVKNSQRGQTSRYGGALESTVHQNLGGARAAASATRVSTLGQRRAGTILSNAGKLAMSTQESAAFEAASSAEYATAVALKSRNQQTAESAAAMQFELTKMKVEQKYAREAMEAEYDFRLRNDLAMAADAREALTEQNDAAFAGIVARVQNLATDSFQPLQQLMNTKNPETGEYATGQEAGVAYATQLGYEVGSDQYDVITAVAQNMYAAGAGPTNIGSNPLNEAQTGLYGAGTGALARQDLVLDAVKETLMSYYPDQSEAIDTHFDVVRSKADTAFVRNITEAASNEGNESMASWGWWDKMKYLAWNPWTAFDIAFTSADYKDYTEEDKVSDAAGVLGLALLIAPLGAGKIASLGGATVFQEVGVAAKGLRGYRAGTKAAKAVEGIEGLSGLGNAVRSIVGKRLATTGFKTINEFLAAARAGSAVGATGPELTAYKTLKAMLEQAL